MSPYIARLNKAKGLSLQAHYWITERNNAETYKWAERVGIQIVAYSNPDGRHQELQELLTNLNSYRSPEPTAIPIVPNAEKARNVDIPSPEEALRLPAEEIRRSLNREAVRLLKSSNPDKHELYARFWDEYSEAIFRARWVKCGDNGSQFFDYKLVEPLVKGGFGQVYRAIDAHGTSVAIKILHPESMEDKMMLDGFRRGVRAMDLLAQRGVDGVVPYIDHWEIPASVVMEYIDGYNLEQAVEAGHLTAWQDILAVSQSIAAILQRSHGVPERVLHRDIRPANIMIRGIDEGKPMEVLLLDFDLSWHREAVGYSVNTGGTLYGYMAPELSGLGNKGSTRSALVDSYGFAMTLLFMITKAHPSFSQHMQAGWREHIDQACAQIRSPRWLSLPRRVSRMIHAATMEEQNVRWDLSRISGELARLLNCLNPSKQPVMSGEIVAEEIMARCPAMGGVYEWNESMLSARYTAPNGLTILLTAREAEQRVDITVDWTNQGDSRYESVRKFVWKAAPAAVSALRGVGFKMDSPSGNASGLHINGSIDVLRLNTGAALNRAVSGLTECHRALEFRG